MEMQEYEGTIEGFTAARRACGLAFGRQHVRTAVFKTVQQRYRLREIPTWHVRPELFPLYMDEIACLAYATRAVVRELEAQPMATRAFGLGV